MKALHIEAEKEDISDIVIMPGDPLRAKYIAENYLSNYKLVNTTRNILGFTGTYRNKKITIMASGMGIPSMAIYAYELFNCYDVKKIIRIGSCGSYKENVKLRDLILVDKSYTDSNFASVFDGSKRKMIKASTRLNKMILKYAKDNNFRLHLGNIHTSEVFYNQNDDFWNFANKYNCLGVEMESFSLLYLAKKYQKQATCLLTVSDSLINDEHLSKEDREKSFNEMIALALNSNL